MGDWVRVEFLAQIPDGMQVTEVDRQHVAEELARFFGFSRVSRLTFQQVNDGEAPPTRTLLDQRPSEGTPIWPSS